MTVTNRGRTQFDGLQLRWHRTYRNPRLPSPKPNAAPREQFDAARIGDVIQLRHWQAGDRFQPLGMPQATKLQNLFTNRKVPAAERRPSTLAFVTCDDRLREAAGKEGFLIEDMPGPR